MQIWTKADESVHTNHEARARGGSCVPRASNFGLELSIESRVCCILQNTMRPKRLAVRVLRRIGSESKVSGAAHVANRGNGKTPRQRNQQGTARRVPTHGPSRRSRLGRPRRLGRALQCATPSCTLSLALFSLRSPSRPTRSLYCDKLSHFLSYTYVFFLHTYTHNGSGSFRC